MMRALILAFAVAACGQAADPAPEAPPPASAQQTEIITGQLTPEESFAAMPSWELARAGGVDFRAVGQEPGWLLDIHTRGIIKFAWDYGQQYAEFAIGEPTYPQEGATRYEANSDGRTLVVLIRRAPCADAMSGESFPSTVQVTIDGQTLRGCGGSV
jgi:uncharacterized membrane protein